MENLLTPSNITFGLGLIGLVFTIYSYFKDPQVDGEKKDALLAQQVQWTIEGNERRFKEIQEHFSGLLLQSNNHIHTVDVKVDKMAENVSTLSNEIIRLGTIIE